MRPLLLCLLVVLPLAPIRPADAAEPFFKKGDVIALVGGEDMVVASEYGYLELLLTRALPDYHLRFRNLAWEGDTVFEQRRDLNFPSYEEQLDKIGATVVIAQFGQMESLAGKERLPEFIAAYEKLIERFSAGGKRRVVLFSPTFFGSANASAVNVAWEAYLEGIHELCQRRQIRFFDARAGFVNDAQFQRDGVHLTDVAHAGVATALCETLVPTSEQALVTMLPTLGLRLEEMKPSKTKPAQLHQLIIAKNRLWFDYWRPQNWAFLAGDRTAQPSSRDHLDPSKRWFPPEREAFLPLIEAKEKEIDALAAQLAKP